HQGAQLQTKPPNPSLLDPLMLGCLLLLFYFLLLKRILPFASLLAVRSAEGGAFLLLFSCSFLLNEIYIHLMWLQMYASETNEAAPTKPTLAADPGPLQRRSAQ